MPRRAERSTGSTRGPVGIDRLDVSEVSLGPAYTSDGRLSHHWLNLNAGGDSVLDLGHVHCPTGVIESQSSYVQRNAQALRHVRLAIDDASKRELKRLEARVQALVKGRLTAEEISGRAVEPRRKLTTDQYPDLKASIEYGEHRKRVTLFYDRRPGVPSRFTKTPPEIEYDSLVPPGGDRPLEGSSVHAFADLAVWINYDRAKDAVEFGICVKLVQVYLVKDGGATRPGGFGGLDVTRPIPVSLKRLRELGIAGDGDEASDASDASDDEVLKDEDGLEEVLKDEEVQEVLKDERRDGQEVLKDDDGLEEGAEDIRVRRVFRRSAKTPGPSDDDGDCD